MNRSEEIFDRLTKDADPRVKISFQHIREACDLIIKTHGILNYSSVGRVCEELFALKNDDGSVLKKGQPTVKTIQQNRHDFKIYIDSKKTQTKNKFKSNVKTNERDEGKYPAPNLDNSTKNYIDNTQAEIKRLKRELKNLESKFLELQKEQPIELTRLLSSNNEPQQENTSFSALINVDSSDLSINKHALEALEVILYKLDETGIVKRLPDDKSLPQSTWVNIMTGKPILTIAQYIALGDLYESF